jgi:hypothetical protein
MLGSTLWSAVNNIHTVSQGGCGRNHSSVAVNIKICFFVCVLNICFCFKQRVQVLFFRFGLLVFLYFLLILLQIILYHIHLKNIQHFI